LHSTWNGHSEYVAAQPLDDLDRISKLQVAFEIDQANPGGINFPTMRTLLSDVLGKLFSASPNIISLAHFIRTLLKGLRVRGSPDQIVSAFSDIISDVAPGVFGPDRTLHDVFQQFQILTSQIEGLGEAPAEILRLQKDRDEHSRQARETDARANEIINEYKTESERSHNTLLLKAAELQRLNESYHELKRWNSDEVNELTRQLNSAREHIKSLELLTTDTDNLQDQLLSAEKQVNALNQEVTELRKRIQLVQNQNPTSVPSGNDNSPTPPPPP